MRQAELGHGRATKTGVHAQVGTETQADNDMIVLLGTLKEPGAGREGRVALDASEETDALGHVHDSGASPSAPCSPRTAESFGKNRYETPSVRQDLGKDQYDVQAGCRRGP